QTTSPTRSFVPNNSAVAVLFITVSNANKHATPESSARPTDNNGSCFDRTNVWPTSSGWVGDERSLRVAADLRQAGPPPIPARGLAARRRWARRIASWVVRSSAWEHSDRVPSAKGICPVHCGCAWKQGG